MTARDDPLLASWQYGLGRSVAWTSDSTGRWAKDWVGWNGFNRFFTQMVSWTFPGEETGGIEATFETTGGTTALHVESVGADGSPRDFYATSASIVGPDLEPATVNLAQVAPGVYEAPLGEIEPGAYAVRVTQTRPGSSPLGRTVGLVAPTAAEYRQLGANEPFLASLRAATGGTVVATALDPWRHDLTATDRFTELWPLLLVLALLLWPLDIALRRMSLGRRELRRHAAGCAGSGGGAGGGPTHRHGRGAAGREQSSRTSDARAAMRTPPRCFERACRSRGSDSAHRRRRRTVQLSAAAIATRPTPAPPPAAPTRPPRRHPPRLPTRCPACATRNAAPEIASRPSRRGSLTRRRASPVVASGSMSPTRPARALLRPVRRACSGRLQLRRDDPAGADAGRLPGHGDRAHPARNARSTASSRATPAVMTVLAPTAIAFDASGLDQPTKVRVYMYVFRNRESFERLRATIDDCARNFVTDPETYELLEQSPFVLVGQGPWGPKFEASTARRARGRGRHRRLIALLGTPTDHTRRSGRLACDPRVDPIRAPRNRCRSTKSPRRR